MSLSEVRIGLDFDNTIISYEQVFSAVARQQGLLGPDFVGGKTAIRDRLRNRPDGEITWQRLQGYVYGKAIDSASLFDGADKFLRRCRQESYPVVIVSHKTEFGHFDPDRVNLRNAAITWMCKHAFFACDGYGLSKDDVYFEATRAQKLARIAMLGCTHFVDDLEEVLLDPTFPGGVRRILFAPGVRGSARLLTCSTWSEIEALILDS